MIAYILPILAVTTGLGVRAVPAPEGVTALLTPGAVLEGCVIDYPGVHGISIQPAGAAARSGVVRGAGGAASVVSAAATGGATEKLKRRRAVTQIPDGQIQAPQKRSALGVRQNGYPLRVTLKNGVLTDILGRIGYIADNRQFQFDGPPQAGAIYTAGFSACPDGTLALGSSNIFYACGSSDFTNLYDTLVYPDNCREVKLFFR